MTRLRTLVMHAPGLTAIAAMVALVSIVWAAPEFGAHRPAAARSAAFA